MAGAEVVEADMTGKCNGSYNNLAISLTIFFPC